MTPSADTAPPRGLLANLLGSAASLFTERQPAETLCSLNARTLADLGIAHVGQGPESLHLAMTDTRRQDVKKSVGTPPVK